MSGFLHGVETIQQNKGPRPVNVVKSAVIGLVGIAPLDSNKNQLIQVNGTKDAAQFGSQVPGFTIPQALDAIFKQGVASVLVVNVFDSTAHCSDVTAEPQVVTAGKLKLAFAPIGTVTVLNNAGEASGFVLGTDYSIDEYGNFKVLSASIANGITLKFTYKKLNAAAITSSVIIGTYNSGTGARTGMKAWALGKNQFGFNPKILIAPGYSSIAAVATEMISQSDMFRSICLLDAAYGTTVSAAIAGRGVDSVTNFKTASKRAYLLYPYLKAYDAATDSNVDQPYSQFMAGVIAANDQNNGYWFSPSNKEIKGIVGVERNITAGASDITSDANILNEAGITTVFNTFGSGYNTWGNRSAAYPTTTTPDQFIAVQRTADVIHESLEQAALQFVDRPITKALIDSIRETANGFIRQLIQRGALLPGSEVIYDDNDNPVNELAAGHLTFSIVMMPPVPGERITFNSFIDISLLQNVA